MKGVFSKVLLKSIKVNNFGNNGGYGNNVNKNVNKPSVSRNGKFANMFGKNVPVQNTQPAVNVNAKTAVSVLAALNNLLSIPFLQKKDFENLVAGMSESERAQLVAMLYAKSEVKEKKTFKLGGLLYLLYLFLKGMIGEFTTTLSKYNSGK